MTVPTVLPQGTPEAITKSLNIHLAMLYLVRWCFALGICWSVLGCTSTPVTSAPEASSADETSTTVAATSNFSTEKLLEESWHAYQERFIQADGRVIDWESDARTVSEAQAYAMLRAVLADDPATFDLTLSWAEDNLRRSPLPRDPDGVDSLWAWKWGKHSDGQWGILDNNFASDADVDAITALIWADRRWDRPEYRQLALEKLEDLWLQATYPIAAIDQSEGIRYLLPGPLLSFQPAPNRIYLNPSYFAPYAFRLFAQVDPERDWTSLVDSSYRVLEQTQRLSPPGLPADWIELDLASQQIRPVTDSSLLQSRYGFDAYRVWWRLAWDANWSGDERAQQFLNQHLAYFKDLWQSQQFIPAVLALDGKALVDYETTVQYAMLYLAFQQVDPSVSAGILEQKLLPAYKGGIWDNDQAYYVQNLAWLGLFPPESIPQHLLR